MATDQLIARDAVIRQAGVDHGRAMQSRDLVLSHEDIAGGFMFEGQRGVRPRRAAREHLTPFVKASRILLFRRVYSVLRVPPKKVQNLAVSDTPHPLYALETQAKQRIAVILAQLDETALRLLVHPVHFTAVVCIPLNLAP
jgi:hypothetical protein